MKRHIERKHPYVLTSFKESQLSKTKEQPRISDVFQRKDSHQPLVRFDIEFINIKVVNEI